jgi:hypothetical protein
MNADFADRSIQNVARDPGRSAARKRGPPERLRISPIYVVSFVSLWFFVPEL